MPLEPFGEIAPRKWLSHFQESHFDMNDSPRSERPSEFDKDHLDALIHTDPHQSSRELHFTCKV